MKVIEMPKGTSYLNAKRYAGNMMSATPSISSVRVKVEKETHKIFIEYNEFPQNVVKKLVDI
jgi:hypothetical protein